MTAIASGRQSRRGGGPPFMDAATRRRDGPPTVLALEHQGTALGSDGHRRRAIAGMLCDHRNRTKTRSKVRCCSPHGHRRSAAAGRGCDHANQRAGKRHGGTAPLGLFLKTMFPIFHLASKFFREPWSIGGCAVHARDAALKSSPVRCSLRCAPHAASGLPLHGPLIQPPPPGFSRRKNSGRRCKENLGEPVFCKKRETLHSGSESWTRCLT